MRNFVAELGIGSMIVTWLPRKIMTVIRPPFQIASTV